MGEFMKKSSVTFSKKDLLNELVEEDEEEVMSRRGSERCRRPARSPGRRSSPRGQVQYGTAEGEGLGVNPQTRQAQLPDKLPTRPTARDQRETHGSKLRKPRDRPFIDTKARTRLPPPPLGHSMGHGLLSPRQPTSIAAADQDVPPA